MTSAGLQVSGLVAGYEAGLPIVKGASLYAAPGRILALLGPNGAGKSTLVKAIAGLVPVSEGDIHLEGRSLRALPAHRMIGSGLAYVPQTDNVFANLTVAENLELAAALLALPRRATLEPIYTQFPELAAARARRAGQLSGGQRQMLAIARALLARPAALLLDEPSAGLSPKLVAEVFDALRALRATHTTGAGAGHAPIAIVLVEQNVKAALATADDAVVLVDGRERLCGPARELAADPRLPRLFLGHHEDDAAAHR